MRKKLNPPYRQLHSFNRSPSSLTRSSEHSRSSSRTPLTSRTYLSQYPSSPTLSVPLYLSAKPAELAVPYFHTKAPTLAFCPQPAPKAPKITCITILRTFPSNLAPSL